MSDQKPPQRVFQCGFSFFEYRVEKISERKFLVTVYWKLMKKVDETKTFWSERTAVAWAIERRTNDEKVIQAARDAGIRERKRREAQK